MASAAPAPTPLAERRERAAQLAEKLELPTFKGRPGWEFTDISGLDLEAYGRAPQPSGGADVPRLFGFESGAQLVQLDIDGGSPMSRGDLPEGVILTTLERACEEYPDLIERYLGSIVEADDVFIARNEARFTGGAFVYVPEGVAVEQPIVLTAIQSAPASELDRRTLIVIEPGAQAEVWEQYLSAGEELDAMFNVVTELIVADNGRLRYVCGQDLSERSWIFGAQRAEVHRDASLDWVALGFGSARGRVRMQTKLAGQGAGARVTGAYATHARQHIDFDTTQEHAAPNTTSDLAFRGVLQDRSTAVWKGNIIVDPGAQKTDAFQDSRNLLLSKQAHADSIPGLEIQANDVRCTHAAAVAQVDPEQLFYLRSRGLTEDGAKRLVIEGFLSALVERFEQGPVREVLADALERRLELVLG
ncbi:MAG: Fe-S cluster assembly protein SufD [Solirubrobacteraceae bacterium]